MWAGLIPPWTVEQALAELRNARTHAVALRPGEPAALDAAARAAATAAAALRVVLLGSGRTTYAAMHTDDRTYVAYDMTRRLQLLAEAVREPRSWAGVADRALWIGEVAEWSGFDVGPEPDRGLASLAPLIGELRRLRPHPGADPAEAALRLVEPIGVAVVQHAMHWALPAAELLASGTNRVDPDDRPRPVAEAAWAVQLEVVLGADPRLRRSYQALVEAENDLAVEFGPTKRAGGHMDVRPDEVVVRRLEWQAAAAVDAIGRIGREHLGVRDESGPAARDAYDLLAAVGPDTVWIDESVRALRALAELALVQSVRTGPV